jgi:uncharacterized membrane protein
MDSLGWLFLVLAVALLLGAISTAWRAFSRPPRVRSAAMKALDERYFEGEIDRQAYLREKAALERKEKTGKAARQGST